MGSLIATRFNKLGYKDSANINIVKTSGDNKQTEFYYEMPCQRARQQAVIEQLKDVCKDKGLSDTVTKENEPDEDESSSSESEEGTTRATQKATAAPTQKATAAPTQKPSTARTTQKAAPKSRPAGKPVRASTIDCDKDHKVSVKDDNTVTGVLRFNAARSSRFGRKANRCTNVGNKMGSLIATRFNKLGYKDSANINIVKTSGDNKQTEFYYEMPCQRARQQAVIEQLKDVCKDKGLSDTVTKENEPDEDESSSSESEEGTTRATQKATAAPTQKPSTARTTQKAAPKSRPAGKPVRPSTIDCDKDHKVSVKDDNTVSGVLRFNAARSSRFGRKAHRCTNVGNKMGSLIATRFNKLGYKDSANINIVKTSGDNKQTEFYYEMPCQRARQQAVIEQLKDVCKDKGLSDTVTKENEPDEDESSSSESEEGTTRATQKATAAPTQKPSTARTTQKAAPKSRPAGKPVRPSTIDCDKDHKVSVKDDNTVSGVLRFNAARSSRFGRKAHRCTNVGNKMGSLIATRFNKLGYKDSANINIVKTSGDNKQTEFYYEMPCQRARQQAVIEQLKDVCKDKGLSDTVTKENEPDEDESSSSESEEGTTRATQKATAAPTQKATAAPTQKPSTARTTQKAAPKSRPAGKPVRPSTIDCDKDHKVSVKDDNTVTGVLRFNAARSSRFGRKANRCTNVGNKMGSLIATRFNKLGYKDSANINIVKTSGDNKQTEFYYEMPCQRARQQAVIEQLKDVCKDKGLSDTVTKENEPDEDESSSSESEEGTTRATQKATAAPTQKATAAPTQKPSTARTTQKAAPKSRPAGKPVRPSTIDCDKDHKVSVKDDNTVTGVLRFNAARSSRFGRKANRCTNVGNKMGSLIATRFNKLGYKDSANINIVKTSGDNKQTEFYYEMPCQRARQQAVIEQLKDVCKDKGLSDTVTKENEPDEDESSSSESEEGTTRATQKATAAPTQKPSTARTTQKAAPKSRPAGKPVRPSTIDCDKDHKVSVKDDNTVTGVLRFNAARSSRFGRKANRCTNVGNKMGSLIATRFNKLGYKDSANINIVKTSGDNKQTEFYYEMPCQRARQQAVIEQLKDVCKDKGLSDTVTKENEPDEDESSSSESEEGTTRATQKATAAPTQKATAAPTQKPSTARTTQKAAPKSRPAGKPVRPSTIDCDKDHKVSVKDDNIVTGVLRFNAARSSRFGRKANRCTNVGNKMGSLIATRFNKLGYKDSANINIVKTSGDNKQTEFYYEMPCQRARQQAVIEQLKDVCKDKGLSDTVTKENEPDEDESSSSESDEDTTKPTQKATAAPTQKATAAPTQKPTTAPTQKATTARTTQKAAPKSRPTGKPVRPSTIDCDKDHKVSVKDDNTVSGVLRFNAARSSRFGRKAHRCTNVGNKMGSLIATRFNKLGYKDSANINIVKTSGDNKQTEFYYEMPCQRARQQAVIEQLKDVCKDKGLSDTVTKENEPDEDESSSSESEEDTTKAATAKATYRATPSPTTTRVTEKEVPQTKATSLRTTRSGKSEMETQLLLVSRSESGVGFDAESGLYHQ